MQHKLIYFKCVYNAHLHMLLSLQSVLPREYRNQQTGNRLMHLPSLLLIGMFYFSLDMGSFVLPNIDVVMKAIASLITSLTVVYLTVYSGADQRKHQSSASLAFVRGIHRWPVNSPRKWPVTRNMFLFDDVRMEKRAVFVLLLSLMTIHPIE